MANQLYFQPTIQSVQAGVPFTLEIWIDTQGIGIDGCDIIVPLQGLILNNLDVKQLLANKFNASTPDKIFFEQNTSGGTVFTGAGVLAVATLTATKDTILTFDWIPPGTANTNIAVGGVDILTTVGNAIINITSNTMPAALLTLIQNWLTANAKGATLAGTYTPPPTPGTGVPFTIVG